MTSTETIRILRSEERRTGHIIKCGECGKDIVPDMADFLYLRWKGTYTFYHTDCVLSRKKVQKHG